MGAANSIFKHVEKDKEMMCDQKEIVQTDNRHMLDTHIVFHITTPV
jgi:hypothetical protein